jgi:hypothetical protein
MTKIRQNWFFKSTEEQQKTVAAIQELKTKYPSFKVVGRGTIVISPRDITSSDAHKRIIEKAGKLVNS